MEISCHHVPFDVSSLEFSADEISNVVLTAQWSHNVISTLKYGRYYIGRSTTIYRRYFNVEILTYFQPTKYQRRFNVELPHVI